MSTLSNISNSFSFYRKMNGKINIVDCLVTDAESLKNATILKTFKSKKNTVCLIALNGKTLVLKWYQKNEEERLSKDYRILSQSDTIFRKPDVFEKNNTFNYLLLEYISADNVCDLINDEAISFDQKKRVIISLAQWFSKFHESMQSDSTSFIHGDANLRNFLYKETIYGLDFEDSRPGKHNQDIADLCASILTTTPSFTEEKQRLCTILIESYEKRHQTILKNIHKEIDLSIQRIKIRRKKRSKMD